MGLIFENGSDERRLASADRIRAYLCELGALDYPPIVIVRRDASEDMLTLGVGRSMGFAIWHPAMTRGNTLADWGTRGELDKSGDLDFAAQGQVTSIPAQYLVSRDDLVELLSYFDESGERWPGLQWSME